MSKYSSEFKLEVVKYYLEGHHSYSECMEQFNMRDFSSINAWVRKYQKHGVEGLVKKQNLNYDGKFKQNVVEYMQGNHLSARETAYEFNVGNHNVVLKWERIYNKEGPQGLYKEKRGVTKEMHSKKVKKSIGEKTKEELIEENQCLQMENDYLKKLNALVQERIKRENKKK